MPTMTSPLDQDYRRVIGAKFATNRKGEQIICRYCTNPIVVGRDFACADGLGKWHNVCTVCADSRSAQVAGLIQKVEALAATLTGTDLTDLITQAQAIDTLATDAINGDQAKARNVTPVLLSLLDQTRQAVTQVSAATDPFAAEIARLQRVRQYLTIDRDATFADSLLKQWATKGYLSEKQRPWVTTFADKGETVESDALLTPITQAILARADGRPSLRFAIPSGGNNDLDFLAVFVGRVERHIGGVNNGDPVVFQLPAAQGLSLALRINDLDQPSFEAAQALYGQAMGHCGRCGSALSDQQSRAQGFGPDCITKVGL